MQANSFRRGANNIYRMDVKDFESPESSGPVEYKLIDKSFLQWSTFVTDIETKKMGRQSFHVRVGEEEEARGDLTPNTGWPSKLAMCCTLCKRRIEHISPRSYVT